MPEWRYDKLFRAADADPECECAGLSAALKPRCAECTAGCEGPCSCECCEV